MQTERVEIQTADGAMDADLLLPNGQGPWPLVVFYMDALGLRPALHEMAQHLTDGGYAVVQPNLYWQAPAFEPFDPSDVFTNDDERKRLFALIATVEKDQVVSDTHALLSHFAADARVTTSRDGTVGYCLGGRTAFIVGTELPFAAVASIHGGGLVNDTPTSPHLACAKFVGAVYLGVADEDRSCTPEHQAALDEALTHAGVDYELELFVGAKHGFAVPDFLVYDKGAAGQHWKKVLGLFDRTLRR